MADHNTRSQKKVRVTKDGGYRDIRNTVPKTSRMPPVSESVPTGSIPPVGRPGPSGAGQNASQQRDDRRQDGREDSVDDRVEITEHFRLGASSPMADQIDLHANEAEVAEMHSVHGESEDVANVTLVNNPSGLSQASATLTQPSNTTSNGTGTMQTVPIRVASSTRNEPMRIVIDRALNPETIRQYVEIDGRRLEQIQRDSDDYFASEMGQQQLRNQQRMLQQQQQQVQFQRTVPDGLPRDSSHVAGLRRTLVDLQQGNIDHGNKFVLQTRIKMVEKYYDLRSVHKCA